MTAQITSRDVAGYPHEHEWDESKCHQRFCTVCQRTLVTVQVSQNGKALGEYTAMIPAPSEVEAVDYFLRFARTDLRYRFLGESGIVNPSLPVYTCPDSHCTTFNAGQAFRGSGASRTPELK